MAYLFQTLASIINIYSFLCFIRIILTWIPGASYSGFGRFLSGICDPFLNMFRGVRWMQIGNLDFSPAVSIGLLYALSSILSNIAMTGRIYFGGILAIVISMFWSIIASLVGFLLILLIIRFIAVLTQKRQNYYGSFWSQLDYALEPFVYRVSKFFSSGKFISYKNAMLVTIIILSLLLIGGQLLITYLIHIVQRLPF
ncbi:MAG TPA: YggT family protein [Treponema sp.]|nr:YggT family protein [Treponema sp.]